MKKTRNKKGYIVNDQGRECSTCKEFKLWHSFHFKKQSRSGYMSQCKECMVLIRLKRISDPKRIELFNNIKREYVYGYVREDGMVFLGYKVERPIEVNFEKWGTKEAYNKAVLSNKNANDKRRIRFSKIERKYKRGDVRGDGMKFWAYCQVYASTNFEKWATEDEFELLQFNTTKKSYMKTSLGKFGGKDEPSDKIVGLNDHDLSCYVESLFEEGMTWKNRGSWRGEWNPKNPKWHLDHIIPLDAANTLEEAKMLWHYTNLRPMWGNENLSKSNKHCKKELAAFLKKRKAAMKK